jgi:hypothetical protein
VCFTFPEWSPPNAGIDNEETQTMTTETFSTDFECAECGKAFGSPKGLLGHQNRVGHKGSVIAEKAKPERKPGQKRTPQEKIADGKAEDRLLCQCGCGEMPKGKKSKFLPGHDARWYSAQKQSKAKGKAA